MSMQFFDPHKLASTIKQMALPAAQKAQAGSKKNTTATPSGAASSRGLPKAKSTDMPAIVPKGPKEFADKGVKYHPTSSPSGGGGGGGKKSNPKDVDMPKLTIDDGFKLVWEDDFNGHELDGHKWHIPVNCRPSEFQCYTDKPWNVYTKKGTLNLHARVHRDGVQASHCLDDCETTFYTSGRVQTKKAYNIKYGRVEVRAKMPDGDFLWPTIWMLPSNNTYGAWPMSGEIDIIETTGNDPTVFSSTIHYGNDKFKSSGEQSLVNDAEVSMDLSKTFHVFRLDWNATHIDTFIDNVPLLSMPLTESLGHYSSVGAPFDQPFHLVMNVAVGGTFFGERADDLTVGMAEFWNRPYMEVDWVRVYDILGPQQMFDLKQIELEKEQRERALKAKARRAKKRKHRKDKRNRQRSERLQRRKQL